MKFLSLVMRINLVRLFKVLSTIMYGCELWSMMSGKRAMRELCVAYHSCLKKLVQVPKWTRSYNLRNELKLMTSPMLIVNRQLLFLAETNF